MAVRRINWSILLLLFIILLAALLRFWKLETLPPGLYHDEAYYGLDALSLLQGKTFPQYYEGWELYSQDAHAERPAMPTRFPVFFEGNYGREPLHVYLVALSINLLGNTPTAIRAVTAAAGTLAVFTTWLAARAIFPPDPRRLFRGELLPLLAAFSLAVLYPSLHFSRFGIRAMTMLPPMTLAVYTFWRAWRSQKGYGWWALSGFFVGLSLYTFAAARLFPLVFVLFAIYLLVVERAQFRKSLRGVALATLAALLTAAPLLVFFARYPYFFVFRMAYVANRGKGVVEGLPVLTWLLNVGRVIGGLFWQGETHLRHNLPGRPYMDPVQAGLFIGGMARGLRFWRKPEYVFALVWLGVMLLPSIMSGDAPHFGRLTGAAPAVAILIAVGGTWLAEFIDGATKSRWPAFLVIMALCAFSLLMTGRDYFVRYASHPQLARDFYQDDWELGRFAATQPDEPTLYLSPSQEEMATIYFALGDPDRIRSFNGQDGLVPAGIPGRPILYLVRPSEETTLNNLQAYFPGGQTGAPQNNMVPFLVPGDAQRVRTDELSEFSFGDRITLAGISVQPDEDGLIISLTWQADDNMPVDYTAFIHLIDQSGNLVAQTDRPPIGYPTSDWRPGEIITDRFRLDFPANLEPGNYRLQTGFYDPATIARLGDAADLGRIEIP